MPRYKGGSRAIGTGGGSATALNKLTEGMPIQITEITPRLYRSDVSEADIRKTYAHLRPIAEKRIKRLKEKGEGGAWEYRSEGFPTTKSLKTKEDVIRQLNQVASFLTSQRSSRSGLRKTKKETVETLQKHGIKVSKDQQADFGRFMGAMSKALGQNYYSAIGSDTVAAMFQNIMDDTKKSKRKFLQEVKDLLRESAKGGQLAEREYRSVRNSLNNNDINELFGVKTKTAARKASAKSAKAVKARKSTKKSAKKTVKKSTSKRKKAKKK